MCSSLLGGWSNEGGLHLPSSPGKDRSPEEIKSNLERIDEIAKNLAAIYPDVLLLSPLHAFSFYDPRGPQEQVLGQCVAMLEKSDELWVFGEWWNSLGCLMEIDVARRSGKPVVDMTSGEDETLRGVV